MNEPKKPSLLRRPFASIPSPEFLYRAGSIDRALQETERCIERVEGVACIIGNSGLGKSMLCQTLIQRFRREMYVVHLNSGRLCTRRALLQNLLFELGLPFRDMEEGELRLSLAEFVRSEIDCPNGLLLLIDEAHTLPSRLLEEIRLLTNQVVDDRPGIRLVLVGTSRLEERLSSSAFESLNQRIVTRCYLEPLSCKETGQFVRHQLDIVHSRQLAAFDESAVQAVYTATDGIPRLINQLCDHALLLAEAHGVDVINAKIIEESWSDLQQLPAPWHMDGPATDSGDRTSTVIEFGELDEPSGVAKAMSAVDGELPFEIETSARINPLLETDDEIGFVGHALGNQSKSKSAHSFDSEADLEPMGEVLEFGDDATTLSASSKHADDKSSSVRHETEFEELLDETDDQLASIQDSLAPLPLSTPDKIEEVDLDLSDARLTTDPTFQDDSNVDALFDDEHSKTSSTAEDTLAADVIVFDADEPEVTSGELTYDDVSDSDSDCILELPEITAEWTDEPSFVSAPSDDRDSRDEDVKPAADETNAVENLDTDPIELGNAPPLFTFSLNSDDQSIGLEDELELSDDPFNDDDQLTMHEPQRAAEDRDHEIDNSGADNEISQIGSSFESTQRDDKQAEHSKADSLSAEDSVDELDNESAVHMDDESANAKPDTASTKITQPIESFIAPPNPFDEPFEDELVIEPLYASTLNQNRSTIQSTISTTSESESFYAALRALQPVDDAPGQAFPLSVHVKGTEAAQGTAPAPGVEGTAEKSKSPSVMTSSSREVTPKYPAISTGQLTGLDSKSPQHDTQQNPSGNAPHQLVVHRDVDDAIHASKTSASKAPIDGLAENVERSNDASSTKSANELGSKNSPSKPDVGLSDDELDDRILREIVSFRDVAFSPASDPVMPEFRPTSDEHGDTTSLDKKAPSDVSKTQKSTADSKKVDVSSDLPEIVLVDPVIPHTDSVDREPPPGSSGTKSNRETESENGPTGTAHREDYRSLFDRLKG